MMRKLLVVVGCVFVAGSSLAGEVAGNTFVGKRNGSIEVVSPGGKWELRDMEAEGPTAIVSLKLKEAIQGSHPGCAVTSMPGMVASVEMSELADLLRKNMVDAGMGLGLLETRRLGGKNVQAFSTLMVKNAASAKGETFLLRGEKDYFVVNCSASSAAYEAARPLFAEVVGSMKY